MGFSLIQARVKAGKFVHQEIVNEALLVKKKHLLKLGACVSTVAKFQQ